MNTNWSALKNSVSSALLDAIEEFGFTEMTPVQVSVVAGYRLFMISKVEGSDLINL